jgi:murein DD-endopeptidase MepM/ murein hydrolase activator NlpD
VGRTRSEDGLDADLAADPVTGERDWDAAWAASQDGNSDDGSHRDRDDDRDDDREGDAAGESHSPRRLRRPPGRRAPVLLAAAVVGAVLTGLLGGWGGSDTTPVASGEDYGLGVSDASFSGGVDVVDARGEISQAEAQARLGEIAASRAAREPDFVVPTDGRLTTCFCQRWGTMHWGIDLAAPLGTPIYAAADGVVLRAGPASGYGNAVYIQDADGNVEIYGHMKYYNVAAGDVVSAGDQIAKVGNQGQSTGPHLHFEIHVGGMSGKPTDPQDWLAERGLSVD